MNGALALTSLMIELITQAQQIGMLIQKARAENRDISDEEMDALVGIDNAAKIRLQAAISASQTAVTKA
jgi:hypothetical protein